MTKANWFIMSGGKEYYLHVDAMKRGELVVIVDNFKVTPLGQWSKMSLSDDVKIETKMLTASVITPTWSVNVTSKPIYGLVPPVLNATHMHGRWEDQQRRFDVQISGSFPQVGAHGIVGQHYRDLRKRAGKMDEYGVELKPEMADSDGVLPEMTTSGLSHAWGSRLPAHYDGPLIHRAKHFAMAVHQRVLQWRVWRRVEINAIE